MYVEAWVSVMVDMQSLPLFVVSSPFTIMVFWLLLTMKLKFPFSFLVVFVSFFLKIVELEGGRHFFRHPKVGWRILFKFQYVKVPFHFAHSMFLHNM
jgi:hypothetical protein